MANPFLQVSYDCQLALTEFSTAFDGALVMSVVNQWARGFGLVYNSKAIQTVFPIPISAAGYVERKGDEKLRDLFARSLTMQTKEWSDGVMAESRRIEAPDFMGWGSEPSRIANETLRQPNLLVAEILEANPVLDFYQQRLPGGTLSSALTWFHGAHPANVLDDSFGTFDNDRTATGINAAFVKDARQYFRSVPAANGRRMGLIASDLLVHPDREEEARDFLESDLMYLAALDQGSNTNQVAKNRYANAFNLVVVDEFTDPDIMYVVAKGGPDPYILQDGGTPEQINYTKDDQLWKDTGKVGVKYILTMAAAPALPHSIARYTIA